MLVIYLFNCCINFYINVYNVVMVIFEILGEFLLKFCLVNIMGNENYIIIKKLRIYLYVMFFFYKEIGEIIRGEVIFLF